MTAQSMEDVPFDIANYRVLIYEQSISGSRKLTLELEKAIHELLAALDRTNNPLQDVLSQRSILGVRRKTPIAKYINLANLPLKLRKWLTAENIVYAEDIASIDVQKMAKTPVLGKVALGKFFAAVLEHDLYPNAQAIQDVIMQYGIKTKPDSRGCWS